MDGRNRSRRVPAIVLVMFASCLNTGGRGGDDPNYNHKWLPDNAPIYLSSRLHKKFLGAVSVHLRLDDKVSPRRAEMGLMQLVSPSGAKPKRYKTKVVPILLEKTPGNTEAYIVSRMPADLIKPDETLTVRLTAASGDGENASLILCGSDGNICGEIKLAQVPMAKEPVPLQTEKADDGR
jgi:hypothetical protein